MGAGFCRKHVHYALYVAALYIRRGPCLKHRNAYGPAL